MPSRRRFAVVGAGIIGSAVARALALGDMASSVTVLEKETSPGTHQTRRNSGVVHAGLYYQPGSAKARLSRRGVALLRDYCEANNLAYLEYGKVLVALDEAERRRMADIHARALANEVPGVRLLTGSELRAIEPHVHGIAGLHSPHTAVVDFADIARSMLADARDAGAVLHTGVEAVGFDQSHGEVQVRVNSGEVLGFDNVILCAGLHSDRLAQLAGDDEFPRIVPFRGEYGLLRPERRHFVRGLVYPVPDPRYPFLGVHLTRRVDGEVLVGPNAVLALAREGYLKRDVDLRQLRRLVGWRGFRRFARANWRVAVREINGSTRHRAFVRAARRYLPELRAEDVVSGPVGIRAQAMNADGSLVEDFRISRVGNIVCVRNAPSPAATASLAIAEHIVAGLNSAEG